MSATRTESVTGQLRQAGNALLNVIAAFIEWLPQASALRIAMVCIALAFVMSILPMAVVLFIVFMVVKMIALAIMPATPRLTVDAATSRD